MKGTTIMIVIMLISIGISSAWDALPLIKDSIHILLDPSFGALMDWHLSLGFAFIAALLTFITTVAQKYLTDQTTIREMKKEQKLLQEQMKQFRDHPEKLMELQKKSLESTMNMWPLISRPLLYTIIPFILFLRWFGDYFALHPGKIYNIFSTSGTFLFPAWIWAYILSSIVFSSLFRKWMKVV